MGTIDIKSLITKEFEQKVQNSFALATGYGIVFVDPQGNHIGGGSNFTKFCLKINSMQKGREACARCNKEGFDVALKTHKPCTYICHAGLVNIVIPFHYDDCYIGALTAGQVMCTDSSEFLICKENLIDEWLSDDELREYYKEIKTIRSDRIGAMIESLANIQDYIFDIHIRHEMKLVLEEKERKLLIYEKQSAELERELKASQLEMLQKKIIPHFMFNVMNSISRLISMNENEKAQSMLTAFSKMMRYKASNTKLMVDLEEELSYIKNYLSIQNIRFSGKINYKIVCSDGLEGFKIPFFSLQPFVENSIEHGILNSTSGGTLQVLCQREKDDVIIKIVDDGVGIEQEELAYIRENILSDVKKPPENHLGMFNCMKRYKVVFDKRANIEINSQKCKGTTVVITIRKQ